MPEHVPAAEKALRVLQRLVRRPPDGRERVVMTGRLPDDLATTVNQSIMLLSRDPGNEDVAVG